MNKLLKRAAALLLATALVALVPLTVAEAAAQPDFQKNVTIFVDPYKTSGFDVSFANVNDRVSSYKLANKAIATIVAKSHTYWEDEEGNGHRGAFIELRGNKVGKTTMSFKVGKKTYKANLNVLAYANPIKSANICGIKGENGKTNLAAETAKTAQAIICASNAATNKKISFQAANGYKIVDICITERNNGPDNWDGVDIYAENFWDKPLAKKNITLDAPLKCDGEVSYFINVCLWNEKLECTRNVEYNIYY